MEEPRRITFAGRQLMKNMLIVGVETIVGGNLAATLAAYHHVTGLTTDLEIQIAGCEIRQTPLSDEGQMALEDIRRELAVCTPDVVIVCGPASKPVWSLEDSETLETSNLQSTGLWAKAVARTQAKLIMISSDAVFHGPWMFHDEDCTGYCQSEKAIAIRRMESQVLQACPSSLVLRANVIGWSPQSGHGWLENLIDQIAEETPLAVPAANYATPIEAGCFSELVLQACDRGLEGLYHAGGSERVNFRHFTHRLAQELLLPRPRFSPAPESSETHLFGQGETSLNSARFRREVGSSLPLLSESLKRLREQSANGDRERLTTERELALPAA